MQTYFKILLVEDNPGDVMLMEELLMDNKRFSFAMENVNSLKKALEVVQNESFDVILLDLGLPDSQGLEALEFMLEKIKDVPIVVITGLDDDDTGQKAINLGAQNYIIKGLASQRFITSAITYAVERNKIIIAIRDKEQKLEHSNRALLEANQSKERLIAMLSHDLRGPVETVVSLIQILHENYDDFSDEKKKHVLNTCITGGKRAVDLMEMLLEWARSQSNTKTINAQATEIATFINKTLEPLQQGATEKSISLTNAVSQGLSFYADPDMISTVVRNLVSNAIKFTPSGGTINVTALKVSDDIIAISVEDSGVGIKEEDLDKLFDISAGYTTSGTNNEKGTGFGLILCKEFVEKNNGNLTVKSKPGMGTIMSIDLPIA